MNVSDCVSLGLSLPEQEVSLTQDRHVITIASVCLSLLTVFTVFANITVIIALVQAIIIDRSKVTLSQSNHGKMTKLIMTSMAVSDSFLGAFIMPICVVEVIHNGKWAIGSDMCVVKYCIDFLLSATSTLHILAMTLDRYLAICHPLRYRLLTYRHAYVILTLTWLIPAGFLTSWIFLGMERLNYCVQMRNVCNMYNFSPEFLTAFICIFIIPFIIVYFLYVCILRELAQYKQALKKRMNQHRITPYKNQAQSDGIIALARKIDSSQNNMQPSRDSLNFPTNEDASHLNVFSISSFRDSSQMFMAEDKSDFSQSQKSAPNRKPKTFRTIGIVMIGFTICWLPSWILALVFLVRRNLLPNWFMVCTSWLAYSNSAISPVLYCCNRSVKRAVRSLLCP